jgi:hypothetical protein
MISNKHTLLILSILIILSKEILVFNEEILVLFSFVVFFSLSYNFVSGSISHELDLRSNKIKEEFDFYKEMKEKTILHLVSYYKKQKSLSQKVKLIFYAVKNSIDFLLTHCLISYLKELTLDIEEKLKKTLNYQSKVVYLLQKKISSEIFDYLYYAHIKSKKKPLKLLLIPISSLLKNI